MANVRLLTGFGAVESSQAIHCTAFTTMKPRVRWPVSNHRKSTAIFDRLYRLVVLSPFGRRGGGSTSVGIH